MRRNLLQAPEAAVMIRPHATSGPTPRPRQTTPFSARPISARMHRGAGAG